MEQPQLGDELHLINHARHRANLQFQPGLNPLVARWRQSNTGVGAQYRSFDALREKELAWSAAAGARVEVTMNGMVCSFCAQGIERNLRRLSLTEAISVDLKQHRVTISVKPGAAVDD